MNTRSIRRGLLAATLLAGTAAIVGPAIPHAGADCLSAEVYLTRSGSTSKQYLVGPRKCVVPTPLTQGVTLCDGDEVVGLPAGTPNGYQWCVWLPTP